MTFGASAWQAWPLVASLARFMTEECPQQHPQRSILCRSQSNSFRSQHIIRCSSPHCPSRRSLHYKRTTLEHGDKHLLDIVASLGRYFPAIEVELLLELIQRPFGSDLSLIDQVGLVAHNEDRDFTEVHCLICVGAGVLARRSQF